MARDLLLEIGCEDLPARYVRPLAEALRDGVTAGLDRRGIARGDAALFATPRRLAVHIAEVAVQQPEQHTERKGPSLQAAFRDGAPTKAAEGFARSCGVAVEALAQEDGYLVHRAVQPGAATAELLQAIFDQTLVEMDRLVPKRMRWGTSDVTFVRPVQWLLALFGDEVAPLEAFELRAGRCSFGHRFHAPAALELAKPADYAAALRAAFVEPDMDARAVRIRDGVRRLAAEAGGEARITDELLEEVAALVEWPVAVAGAIDEHFLALPAEVVVATVETNQRYFTVFDAGGKLLPCFITAANIEAVDMRAVMHGNERVVRPRLDDALFFWRQDQAHPLQDFLPRLDRVTFQKELGSVGDKVRRITALAGALADAAGAPREQVERAAQLAKADLTTQMVFEFPELQGIMGGHYARAGGEPEAVARAVAEHYFPVGAGAPIPADAVGRVVALADKLDTLAGIFAVGLEPTATKDPFALRRTALGVLRILVESGLRLDLRDWLRRALQAQPAGQRDDDCLERLWAFVLERLRGVLAERGVGRELFDAVSALDVRDVADFAARAEAVRAFGSLPEAEHLAAAHKRARNLLRQAGDAGDAGDAGGAVDAQRFTDGVEQTLFDTLTRQAGEQRRHLAGGDYTEALRVLAPLRGPLDAFFDGVMVLDDDAAVRANRLALLAQLDAACREVADLSKLPG